VNAASRRLAAPPAINKTISSAGGAGTKFIGNRQPRKLAAPPSTLLLGCPVLESTIHLFCTTGRSVGRPAAGVEVSCTRRCSFHLVIGQIRRRAAGRQWHYGPVTGPSTNLVSW